MVFNCKTIEEIPDSSLNIVTRRNQDLPLNSVKNKNSPDEEANQMVSFFLILHGDSYVNRVKLFVKGIDGVESVRHEGNSNKLEVMGKVDPFKIQEMVKHATNKEVELIFPLAVFKGDRDENKGSKAKYMMRVMPILEKEVANEKTGECIIDLKIKLCCESCNKNLRKILKTKGLEMLTIEAEKDLVSVKGTVDVTELRSYIKDKLKKDIEVVNLAKVMAPSKKDNGAVNKDRDAGAIGKKYVTELRSYNKDKLKKDIEVVNLAKVMAPSKKDNGAVNKDGDAGATGKKYEGKCGGNMKEEDVGAMMKSTVVLKIRLHCDGCIQKIQKSILKFRGVKKVSVTADKDLVMVTGTMDVQELTSYLKEKIKSNVEVVLVKKKDKKDEVKREIIYLT